LSSSNPNRNGWSLGDSLYLGFIVVLLVAGGTVAFIGNSLSNSYFHASSTTSVTEFKATMLGWSNSTMVENHNFTEAIENVSLDVSVTIPTSEVEVWVNFFDRGFLSHSFALILPFPIKGLSISNQGSLSGNITASKPINITDSSSVVEFTWKDYYNESSWQENQVSLDTYAVGPLVSSVRGEYNFYMPLGIFPPQTILGSASKVSPQGVLFSTARGYGTNATVIIPPGSELEQLIPSTASQGEPAYGVPGEEYDWAFASPQIASSVSVDYQNSTLVSDYQNDLFRGGVLIGVGASAVFGGVFEAGRFAYGKNQGSERGAELAGKPRKFKPSSLLILIIIVSTAVLIMGVIEAIIGIFLVRNPTYTPLFVTSGVALGIGGLSMLAASISVAPTEASIQTLIGRVGELASKIEVAQKSATTAIESLQKSDKDLSEDILKQSERLEEIGGKVTSLENDLEKLNQIEGKLDAMGKTFVDIEQDVKTNKDILVGIRTKLDKHIRSSKKNAKG
jgi:hypothetical protein